MTIAETLTPSEIRRWSRIGVLAACAIILSYLETLIPIPIPGVKIGLANIAVLVALGAGDISGAFAIALIKVGVTGLLFGSPVMMAYSFAGTMLAFVAMAPLSRLKSMHIVMVSVVGALMHEMGQLMVARIILGTPLVWYSTPVLLIAGCVTGAFCGYVAANALAMSKEGERLEAGCAAPDDAGLSGIAAARNVRSVDARIALAILAAFAIITLRSTHLWLLAAEVALAVVACIVGRVRIRTLVRALVPVATIFVITLCLQVATLQDGTTLFSIGPVAITAEALAATGRMTARLLAITAASIAFMHLVDAHELVAVTSRLLSPLKRLGVRTEGFSLALSVAIAFVPVLLARVDETVARMGRAQVLGNPAALVARLLSEADALAEEA